MSQVPQAETMHELFERALAEPPERRAAFLDRACAGRPDLRERIERLLQLAEGASGFLDRGAIQAGSAEVTYESSYAAGRTIGAYRLLRPLGRGGMAEVWLAERREGGFQQQAALKLIPHARGSISQRFFGEREILAGLVHSGIARLYDGGVEADGTAYMVMEYVAGEHLIAYANAHRLPLSERLRLFLQICDAVAYAHTRLVVHRDLKPSNVLVAREGQAKLLDFGIAKLLDADSSGDATRTHYLSPAYAAPEQLVNAAISTATDVYALGVILFELLTGRLPWSDDAAPMTAAVKRLLDAPLPPPSKLATAQSPVPGRVLRGDLDAIVGKALRREANERYPDARSLADDVRRYLDHRPVQARMGARIYVTRRFVRRNWLPLASAALLFVAMAVATVAVAWQANRARVQALRAEAVQGFMVDLFKTNSSQQKDPVKARQTTARELLDIGAKRIESQLDDAPESKLTLLRLFAVLHTNLNLNAETQHLLQQASSLSASLFGEDSSEHVEDMLDLVTAVFDSGDLHKAEQVLRDVGEILDRRKDVGSTQRARFLINSAFVHAFDLARADGEVTRAVEILGAYPPSAELALALYSKGMNRNRMRKPADAVESLQRAVEVSRIAEGVPNANLPVYYYLLASTQRDIFQYRQAEESARQALAFAIAINGEDHPDAIRLRSMLALILADSDRIKEGLGLVSQVKAAVARVLAPDTLTHRMVALQSCIQPELRAGDLDQAMTDMEASLQDARKLPPQATNIASALDRAAEISIELGRAREAVAQLDEASAIRQQLKQATTNKSGLLRARLALDENRSEQARQLLGEFAATGASEAVIFVADAQRDLLLAELELQTGNRGKALELANEAGDRIRSSELAPYLRSLSTDSELVEGLAHVRSGDAIAARPLLEHSLATRIELYLPKSPKIAEAELALAECALAEGKRADAAERIAKAEAIQKQHSSLSSRYVEPLRTLRARLAGR